MSRLANTERGLTPYSIRQLYIACITSVTDYGSVVWWRGQIGLIGPLQALQNRALRRILGVFRTAPIIPMEIEAGLVPVSTRLDASITRYAIRTYRLAPNHPINIELANSQEQAIQAEIASLLPKRIAKRIATIKPTQLQRISTSIARPRYLENLQHYYFAPWNTSLPYTVTISQLPKEEEAIQHNIELAYDNSPTTTRLYSDASLIPSNPSSLGVGIGLVALNQSTRSYIYRQNIGPEQLVYNGELLGVTLAIEYASSIAQPRHCYKVYSDN
jgi:hypothetical protein